MTGINRKNRKVFKYPDLELARRPDAHSDECPVPVYVMVTDDGDKGSTPAQENEETDFSDDRQHPFSQNELNDLVGDLSLSESSSELLAFRLKEKKLLFKGSCITFYRNRHQLLFIFSLKKKIWFTAQILFIFCKSLECHIMNPEIGDYF